MTKPIQPATAKKKRDAVSVAQNIRNRIVYRALAVILAIQIVVYVNVTSMAPMGTSVSHQMANVHANRTMLVISVNDAQKVIMVLTVNHVTVIILVQ